MIHLEEKLKAHVAVDVLVYCFEYVQATCNSCLKFAETMQRRNHLRIFK